VSVIVLLVCGFVPGGCYDHVDGIIHRNRVTHSIRIRFEDTNETCQCSHGSTCTKHSNFACNRLEISGKFRGLLKCDALT